MKFVVLVFTLAACVVRTDVVGVGRVPLAPQVGQAGISARVDVRIDFFGIPLDGAQDVVFVLDRSGSMGLVSAGFSGEAAGMGEVKSALVSIGATIANGATGNHLPSKLDVAKAELIRTLRAMPDGTRFNVIWFDDKLAVMQHHMMRLDPGTRAAAEQFIRQIKTGGSTAAVPALELAYSIGAQRVILLSDGLANTDGGADELLANARRQIERGVRFDTVGLGIDQDGKLLRTLAAESGGLAMMR